MNSISTNNLGILKNDSYDASTWFLAFICGFILGILFKYLKQIKENTSKIREVYANFDLLRNSDYIKMNKGKICSQCCHACLSVYEKILKRNNQLKNNANTKNALTSFDIWKKTGQKKVVLKISSLEEMFEIEKKAKAQNLITSIIVDAGRTQIEPNTETVIAIEPVPDDVVNKITGQLKLL
ncbi:peptidyl-tRNA hydrolase 2, putative [Plasmodium ovale]|uniref:peptidyl-tRNA hydrolase n=1 Tax=Plasmodium ovale TaxID=36330 RepID=A0A1D3KX63_PLAOA|nr:peptidyl-tRNA hydrolase 2, putative [Plasmodium ovale]